MTDPDPGRAFAEPELSRDLGFFAVFATATGTMIGAGIFVLPGVAAAGAGPAAALSFAFAGLIAAIAALSASELATAMPKAGGPYYFVSRAMGPALGTVVGLGAWLALVFKGSFALVGFGQYIEHFTPVHVAGTATALGLVLLAVNYMGAGVSGLLQNLTVPLLLAILAVFVIGGVFAVERAHLSPTMPFGWEGVFSTTGLVFISYLGIVKAAAVSEEVVNPGRTLPAAILTSVALVTVLYVGVMIVVVGVLPLPAAELAELSAPLADAGLLYLGAGGALLVAVAGILATTSTGNAAILASSRYPFAMARDGLMSAWFNRIHRRFRTPSHAIMVTGGVMVVLVLLFDVETLARLGGVFGLLVFTLVNLSVVVLRPMPEYRPAFRAPLYPWLQVVGALAALALIPQMGTLSQIAAAVFVGLGLVWYAGYRAKAGREAIEPAYGLADKIQRVRQRKDLEQKRRVLVEERPELKPGAVVVELVAHKPNKDLLTVAAAVARHYDAPVDAVVVTEVPMQTPLGAELRGPTPAYVRKVERRLTEHGVRLRFHNVQAHDRARAILALVDDDTRLVLLDWHEPFGFTRLSGTYADEVLRRSPARVGLLKHRRLEKYERILVATAGGPYARSEVEVADALARLTGARITLAMVLPPDASTGRKEHAREYLNELAELTTAPTDVSLVTGENVVDAIVEAGSPFDLIMLGASREPGYQRVIGRIPDLVAAASDRSVLITQDPGLQQRWSRRIMNLLRGRPAPAAPPSGFPRDDAG